MESFGHRPVGKNATDEYQRILLRMKTNPMKLTIEYKGSAPAGEYTISEEPDTWG